MEKCQTRARLVETANRRELVLLAKDIYDETWARSNNSWKATRDHHCQPASQLLPALPWLLTSTRASLHARAVLRAALFATLTLAHWQN